MTLRSPLWYERFFKIALLERKEKAQAVARMLQEIAQPGNLRTMFDEFLYEVTTSVHQNTDSYTHDNGFDKIVLFEDDKTKLKMRLHIWHPLLIPGAKRPRQNVHNHRWDFGSVILLGHADHLTYQFAKQNSEGEEFFHYRYYARGSKEHYELEELGKAKLVCLGSERFEAGQLYYIDNEVLHRVDIDDNIAVATLIITHENVGWITNDLLSEKSMGFEKVRLQSPAMAREQIVSKVTALRELLHI
ncbi:MAG TPA: hypothetical protein VIJ29_02135 [Candidatus Paceibacterota bacterium]